MNPLFASIRSPAGLALARCRLILPFVCPAALGWMAVSGAAHAAPPVVVERFDATPSGEWRLTFDTDSDGIFEWSSDSSGLRFMTPANDSSPGSAVRVWTIGTDPFEATWRVELTGGQGMANRAPAIHVAVASAPPNEMTVNRDFAIQMGVGHGGISGGVYTGPFMGLNQNTEGHPPYRSNYVGRWVTNLPRISEGMANIGWFEQWLRGQTVTLRMRRTEDGMVQFAVWHHQLGLEKPWWQAEVEAPPAMKDKPLTHVFATVSPNRRGTPLHGPQSRVRGLLKDLQLRPLGVDRPRIAAIEPGNGVAVAGGELRLRGEHFGADPVVFVDGVQAARVGASDTEILVRLPHTEGMAEGRRVSLAVRHANGLFHLWPGGLLLGRVVEAVRPREVHPGGGDEVVLVGAGFDRTVSVTINGREATVLEVIDSSRIRVRAPAGAAGAINLEVTSNGRTFIGEPAFAYAPHPYIVYRQEELEGLREKFHKPMFADYRKVILDGAASEVDLARLDGSDAYNPAYFAWLAYLMEGEAWQRKKLLDILRVICAQHDHHQFQIQKAVVVATVYDSLFQELNPDERQMMIDYLDRCLDQYLDRTAENDWWFANNPSNTIAVGANGGGFAALALMHSRAADAEKAINTTVDLITNRYISIAEDGSCIEGTLYWDYGLTQQVMLGHAYRKALGDDRGLLSQKRLQRGVDFAMSQMGGNGVMFVNNDTQPFLTGVALAADFGSRYDQPFMRWLADEIVRLQSLDADHPERKRVALFTRAKFIVSAFLYRDETPAPDPMPDLPTLSKLPSVQWATARSGPELRGPMVINVKGHAGPLGHHKNPDKGNFQLHARGEAFIISPGYYASEPRDLNIPLLDGVAMDQEPETVAPITDLWESGDLRGISVEATEAYAKTTGARRVARHFVMVGDEAVVMLDDILPAQEADGMITVQWQAQYATETDGASAIIFGDDSALRIEPHGPSLTLEVEGPRKFARAWVYRRMEEQGLVSWHSTRGTYRAEEAKPLVTVLQRMDKNAEAPARSRARYEQNRIAVTLASGRRVDFLYANGQWAPVKPQAGL